MKNEAIVRPRFGIVHSRPIELDRCLRREARGRVGKGAPRAGQQTNRSRDGFLA